MCAAVGLDVATRLQSCALVTSVHMLCAAEWLHAFEERVSVCVWSCGLSWVGSWVGLWSALGRVLGGVLGGVWAGLTLGLACLLVAYHE